MSFPVPQRVATLTPFVEAGVFGAADVNLAEVVDRRVGGVDPMLHLALALALRATRLGHACCALGVPVDLSGEGEAALPWPDTAAWRAALLAAPEVVADVSTDATAADRSPLRPLVWDGHALYLHRYWWIERAVADRLLQRASGSTPEASHEFLEDLDALFGPTDPAEDDLQRRAAATALQGRFAVVAGGPGTGKTRTIARLSAAILASATRRGAPLPRLALAAPTGKAAARMGDAVGVEVASALADGLITDEVATALGGLHPTTIHRLIGAAPGRRPLFGPDRPLPFDWVIVDEVSMVSLPLMQHLLDAVDPDAGLVLVGDPDQLVSVDVGTVMADVVGPLRHGEVGSGPLHEFVTVLRRPRRFGVGSPVALLADAVRRGDAEALHAAFEGGGVLRWVTPEDHAALRAVEEEVVAAARSVLDAAGHDGPGDPSRALRALRSVAVLAAHRDGPLGVADWVRRTEVGLGLAGTSGRRPEWYVGRPVMATANDPLNGISNGDVGVVMGAVDGNRLVAVGTPEASRLLPPSRLDRVETCWATTIHKSQGSEVDHAVISLPAQASPLLTRELLYTAVTRARSAVTVIATNEALVAALGTAVERASGLPRRLWGR